MPKIPARVNITLTPQMVMDITTIQKSPYVRASVSALCSIALAEGLHTQAAQIEKWSLVVQSVSVYNSVCEPTQSVLTSTVSNEHAQIVQSDTVSGESVQVAQPVQEITTCATPDGETQLVREITTCASSAQAAQPITTSANTPKPSLAARIKQAGEDFERDLKAKEPRIIPNDLTSMVEDRRIAAEADGTWDFPAPKLPERTPDVVVPENYSLEAEDSVPENYPPERPSEDPEPDEEDSDAKFFEDLDLDD